MTSRFSQASASDTISHSTTDHLVVEGSIEMLRTHDYSIAWVKIRNHDAHVSKMTCSNNLLTMDMTKEDGRAMHRVLTAAKLSDKRVVVGVDLKNPCLSYGRRLSFIDLK